ncbi:MAG: hypothetical protein M1827_007023 [Pycnora praestabilis]|nr:MAG: hypothetical protein M1827_007023 [Pycnora praestabilis]
MSFQTIHDDQDLPPGLHIRMNLQTGVKEARLNVPFPGDEDVNAGMGMMAVPAERGDVDVEEMERVSLVEQSGKTPPSYSNDGRIPSPPPASDEGALFASAMTTLINPISDKEKQIAALADLEDLAHDIYYGLEITRNSDLVVTFLNILHGSPPNPPTTPHHRSLVALVLGSALQNNPAAVSALDSKFLSLEGGAEEKAPSLVAEILRLLDREKDAKVQERLLFVLSGLMRYPSDGTRTADFGAADGHSILIGVFRAEGAGGVDGRDGVRGRIADLMLDYFFTAEGPEEEPSGLEGSDAWVLPPGRGRRNPIERMMVHRMDESDGHDTKMLMEDDPNVRAWYDVLSTAMKRWVGRGKGSGERAYGKVEMSFTALKDRMREEG